MKLKKKSYISSWPPHRCFPVKSAKFLRTLVFTEHFQWLLLSMLLFMNVSSFTSLATLSLLPYSTVNFFV